MQLATSVNRAVLQALADALSSGDLERAGAQIAPNFVGHYQWVPQPVEGPDGFKAMYASVIQPAFPDQKITIERDVSSGDRIGIQLSWTATHKGAFLGIPPTGKRVTVAGTGIFKLTDGKIVEAWMREDVLAIYQQLTQS